MGLKETAESLSEIERKTLSGLSGGKEETVAEIAGKTGLNADSVRRAVQWLKEKRLVELREEKETRLKLSPAGKSSLRKGLPEKMFIETINRLGGKASLEKVRKESELNAPEVNVAMGLAKRNAWIGISKEGNEVTLELTGLEKELLEGKYSLEEAIKRIGAGEEVEGKDVNELLKRGLAEQASEVERKAKINSLGEKTLELLKGVKERAYNIFDPAPKIFIGKKQPYIQFLNQIKRKLTEMGFQEMVSPLIVQEFYNFDVLFQPQNHPARDWSDTYQLKNPKKGILPEERIVKKIKAAHENGGVAKSRGWAYKWSKEIASKLMPASHGTAHSARQLVKGVKEPGKYFSIARCFRPDVLDSSHLIEFNQLEGFVVGDYSFRHLLGLLKEFAVEIAGAKKVKFFPDYYPFTEPSVQLSAFHPGMGWMEFGGAGMFRPEMTENLGIKGNAIAWGLGVDRLAMFKLGIKDIRELFSQDLKWLREAKAVEV